MSKKNIGLVAGLICICLIMGSMYSRTHAKIDLHVPDNATTYIYIDSVAPSEKKMLSQTDYESVKKALEEIKYYNPGIDPTSDEYMRWGSKHYAIEMHADGEEYAVFIGTYEDAKEIRSLFTSDSEQCLAAYIPDDIIRKINAIFAEYSLEVKDVLNKSTS